MPSTAARAITPREREVAGEQGQGAEGRGLAAVDDRQGEARRRLLHPRDEQRREQGREEPVPRKRPAVAKALPVRSKTRTERATMPIQSPNSLTA